MPHTDLSTVSAAYAARVAHGELARDPAQVEMARRLDRVLSNIATRRLATKSSALGWLFAGKAAPTTRGLYIHGAVGRGKTMLMDMFFALVPVQRKRRAHFHDFMADVHDRIHAHRQKLARGETKDADPVPPVAAQLVSEAWVLCFDEFSVTDITDAMLLSRLFEHLFKRGCVLIATSNVAPTDLYRDGLNRALFLPFIDLLSVHAEVVNLDARIDYRLEKTSRMPVYHLLGSEAGAQLMDEAWARVTAGKQVASEYVTVKGRRVPVPRAAGGAARFGFDALCEAPLGASDYRAISDRYHTVFIDRVPRLDRNRRNAAKRFIALIDTLYDRKNRLFLSAEAAPDALYSASSGTEMFEFARTSSRLTEMQSTDYLAASQAAQPTRLLGPASEL